MTDGIQKGSGNAYALQTVANAASLYPTYEQFIQAFATGQLFTDLKLNPEGWDSLGTSLNKANLLKDATAIAMGLTASAVPDEALEKLRALVTSAQSTANGKLGYTSGTFSYSYPYATINFGFSPKVVFISTISSNSPIGICAYPSPMGGDVSGKTIDVVWSEYSIKFSSGSLVSGIRYNYAAIG